MLDDVTHQPATVALALTAIVFAVVQFIESKILRKQVRKVLDNEGDLVKQTDTLVKQVEGLVTNADHLVLQNGPLGRTD
ncbi:MAG: hypothetical protein ACLP59_26080 [Bryobacteraceae bacterium]